MKADEMIAREFLIRIFDRDPSYEPLGANTAPDFAIDDVAFEVRRLNQRYFYADGSNEGLEQADFALSRAVDGELNRIRFSADRGSFYWGLEFHRPLELAASRIAKELAKEASEHYSSGRRQQLEIRKGGAKLDLIPCPQHHTHAFIPGYRGDEDSFVCFGDTYPTSIRLAVEEKLAKTREVALHFKAVALILVDGILPGLAAPGDIAAPGLEVGHFKSVVVIDDKGNQSFEHPHGSLAEMAALL